MMVGAGALAAGNALAQRDNLPRKNVESLASVIPESACLFVELDHLVSTDSSRRSENLARLYELLFGQDVSPQGPWRTMLVKSLGLDSEKRLAQLFSRQFAVAAPSWKHLADGVIVVRLIDDDPLLSEIFAPDNYDTIDGKKDVIVYRTRTYLSAATNRDLLVISQRSHTDSLYHGVVRTLLGDRSQTLAGDKNFRQLVGDLPSRRDGTVYVARSTDRDGEQSVLPLPLERIAVGLQIQGDLVNFALRGTRRHARQGQEAPLVSLARLDRLPLSTLAAWSVEFDMADTFRSLFQQQESASPHVKLLMQILDVQEFQRDLLEDAGPRAVFVWDQHLGAGLEIPQLAVLLESSNPLRSAQALADAVQVVVDWFDIKNRSTRQGTLRMTRSDYLGTAVYEISLPPSTIDGPGGPPVLPIKPAFAALTDSVAIALSSDHIRNLVDAEMGLAPTWNSLRDLRSAGRETRSLTMLGVAQPALIAQTVEHWIDTPDGVVARWLSHSADQGTADNANLGTGPVLGIGVHAGARPGTVEVARVQPGGRCADRLHPDDVIFAVNGSVLDLSEPAADLRRRINDAAQSGEIGFRIERQGAFLDVGVPVRSYAAASDPTQALRQLQGLFKLVEFGSIRAVDASPDRLSAQLTLRFTSLPNTQLMEP